MYKPIFSFAPMEGITGYPFRNTFHTFFPEVNRYYTPFLSANESFVFTGRERRDVEPSNNPSIDLIPQIITSNAEMFVFAIEEMTKRGYREVNLNLGCPYRTVVAKGKGSGMLRDPDQLDDFFESCFQMIRQKELHVALSIKTRIGIRSAEEFPRLISVFNHYSFKNIIVHPRLQHDFYKNSVNMDAFHALQSESRSPVSYNGDLNSVADLEYLLAQEPSLPEVMLGRGLLRNPALLREYLGGPRANTNELKEYAAASEEFKKAGLLLDSSGDSTKTRYIYDVLSEVNERIAINSDKEYYQKLAEKEEHQLDLRYKAGKVVFDNKNDKTNAFINDFKTCAKRELFMGDEK